MGTHNRRYDHRYFEVGSGTAVGIPLGIGAHADKTTDEKEIARGLYHLSKIKSQIGTV